VPFQVTVVLGVKPLPFAVNVKPAPPAATAAGEILVSVNAAVMVNGSDAGCGSPVTLTEAVPGAVSNDAGTAAMS